MAVEKIVKEYFPDASDEFIDYVMWEETGFPYYWNIPRDGDTPEECFRKQLAEAKERQIVKRREQGDG